jgi:mRNA interferase RelE/StbE
VRAPWRYVLAPRAIRDLERLDATMRRRVFAALDRLAETEQGDVTRLQGVRPPEWRLRVGDWRVRFVFNYATRTIEVLRVLPRGPAYRD